MISNYAKKLLEENFQGAELETIVTFLERRDGFSLKGQSLVCLIIVFATKKNKTLEEIMQKLEEGWKKHWENQLPEIRGNSHAPGKIGSENFYLFHEICTSLDVPGGFY